MTKNKRKLNEMIQSVYKIKLIKYVATIQNKLNIFHECELQRAA